MLSKLKDPFLLLILLSAGIGYALPVEGTTATALGWVTKAAIFVLFLGYGARLSATEAWAGLRHWRLHGTILACTFVLFPLIGLGLLHLPWYGPELALGLAFLSLVPSTVQSSIAFTSLAGGNVAGAIVSATASNLLGVVLTPLLVMALLPSTGAAPIGWGAFAAVMLQLLLPFVLGQCSRPWTAEFMARHKARLKWLDQGVICLVVYTAFSDFRVTGVRLGAAEFLVMLALCLVILAVMLLLTHRLATWLRFSRGDRVAIVFCGTKKSLATGVPMATVLFAGQPVGLIVFPLMVFHMLQLVACSIIAQRWASRANT
ncbi:MAG: bile acid:sodium symporter family protein [Propionibacteriaceae bacterium]|nr:bile acid:sodium symporter family protein [Propionibacteriaceae bacterium]